MNWTSLLTYLSGPIQAGVRYAIVTLLGGYAVAHGFGTQDLFASLASTVGALIVAGIGVATSVKPVVEAKTLTYSDNAKIVKTDGTSKS